MKTVMDAIRHFHDCVGHYNGDTKNPDVFVNTGFRFELIREEFEELKLAAIEGADKNGNQLSQPERVVAVADALGDMVYVIAGAALTWGIDLTAVVEEIHASNMTKVGGTKRSDGKVLKPDSYRAPDIKRALGF